MNCHFSEATILAEEAFADAEVPRTPSRCTKAAVDTVLRIHKTGRLCPLCTPCLTRFKEAKSRLAGQKPPYTCPKESDFTELPVTPELELEYQNQP
jgi:hypothetical protein